MPGQREPLLGQVEDLAGEAYLVLGAEVLYVQAVTAGHPLDLVAQGRRMGVPAAGGGRKEVADHAAADRRRGVGPGHADQDTVLTLFIDQIPQPRHGDHSRRGYGHAVIAVVVPVAEAVDPEFTRGSSGHHAGPGRHRDGWDGAEQRAPDRARPQGGQDGHVLGEAMEKQLRGPAIETDDGQAWLHPPPP